MVDKLSIRRASKSYGVPFQTLRDRVTGNVDPECCTMGSAPFFTLDEESRLVIHLKEMAQLGYGYNRQEVVDIATDYAVMLDKKTKIDKPLTLTWFYGMLGRWPDLKVVKPRALEVARAKAANKENITKYFNELEKALLKYDLMDKPHLIYNVDEKGVTINHNPSKVVSGVETSSQEVTSGKGDTVTILGCGNAIGNALPPYFVFPGQRMNDQLLEGSTPGTVGTVSKTGWSNSELFMDFLSNHFKKFVPGNGHVMLLLDGHKSHVAVSTIEWARRHNIVIQLLPAHTSHLLQPLDVGCYGPLQNIYNSLCHRTIRTKQCALTRYDVCSMACKAYGNALSASNLQSAFRKTGIYPFTKDIINDLPLTPSEAFISDIENHHENTVLETVEAVNSAVVVRENENDSVVSEREEVESNKENVGVLREGEIGLEVARSVVSDREEVESDKENESVVSVSGRMIDVVGRDEGSKSDFFVKKVVAMKRVKGEKKKKRNVLSRVINGKTVTEDDVLERVKEHVSKNPGKKASDSSVNKSCAKSSKKGQNGSVGCKRKREQEKKKIVKCSKSDSQKPGTSGVGKCVSDWAIDSESESESEIREDEKCCVCKKFVPEQVRQSSSLIFTKWAQCEKCERWVHLIYCTKVRVIRRGDSFMCVFCEKGVE
ncbi:uncharacterized protein LOC127725302 [Mytilus californianus]|uniref:uncharacterized protein LOC127725302 n=1 Tax=Mytilus californianus TaxID=6549 RepID=UPI002246B22D|nr:uncharacterized protein LOC127725302 [Mytilus californianus]